MEMFSKMATAMRLLVLGCVLQTYTDALIIRRSLVPHNAKPGFIVASLTYWGQRYTVDNTLRKDLTRYFTVSSTGDVITSADISELLGSKLSLVINNHLASELWQDAVHVDIQDGNHMLVFSENAYSGFIKENSPPGSTVKGLENVKAEVEQEPKKVLYSISEGSNEAFQLKLKDINGESQVQVVTTKVLDREDKAKYVLTIRAASEDGKEEPVYSRATIIVGDENDNIPRFEKSHYYTTISDDTPALATVVRVKAVDPDDGKVKYVMEPHNLFKIHPEKGHIILKSRKRLDGNSYQLVVYAEDEDGQQSTPVTVHIEVKSSKDSSPLRFESHKKQKLHSRQKRDTHVRSMKEFEVPESMVGELIRLSENDYERFAFHPPAPSMLDINRYTGAVRLKDQQRLDFETLEELNFTVIVTRDNDPTGKK